MTDRLPCRITVAAVVEQKGRFLFVEESEGGRRVLNQPAGHLEPGENLIQGVIRETREETGFDFEPTAWLGCDLLAGPTGVVSLRVAFCGPVTVPVRLPPRDPAIHDLHWLTPEEARYRALRSPLVLRSIQRYRQGLRLPLAATGNLLHAEGP